MRRAVPALAAVVLALGLARCGDDDEPLPEACSDGVQSIGDALDRAPAPVRLRGGVRLSTCVEHARSDAEIQNFGSMLTYTADRLARDMRRSDRAAVKLGYLIGAVREGGTRTNGIHEELVRRVEQTIGLDGAPPARRAAFARGEAAGERTG